ncbi:MAG: hypothetical protein I3J02_06380 [Prevotella sp.]|nr:hypothetical protein [Prevotella sp.]
MEGNEMKTGRKCRWGKGNEVDFKKNNIFASEERNEECRKRCRRGGNGGWKKEKMNGRRNGERKRKLMIGYKLKKK